MTSTQTLQIQLLERPQSYLKRLIRLLEDTVNSGGIVGFLAPLEPNEAKFYWNAVFRKVEKGQTLLWVAQNSGGIVAGSVQLHLALQTNGTHRAEIAKMMVSSQFRRQGLGRRLMLEAEKGALERGRTTLVLNTRAGDVGEELYRSLGWLEGGRIPGFSHSADGSLHTTVIYFKLLEKAFS